MNVKMGFDNGVTWLQHWSTLERRKQGEMRGLGRTHFSRRVVSQLLLSPIVACSNHFGKMANISAKNGSHKVKGFYAVFMNYGTCWYLTSKIESFMLFYFNQSHHALTLLILVVYQYAVKMSLI